MGIFSTREARQPSGRGPTGTARGPITQEQRRRQIFRLRRRPHAVPAGRRSRFPDAQQDGHSKHHLCPRPAPLSPREAAGGSLPFPGLEGVSSGETDGEEERALPKARSPGGVAASALGLGAFSGATQGPESLWLAAQQAPVKPARFTSPHRHTAGGREGSALACPPPDPADGLARHPTSPAHAQPAGWHWLAALRQDMTVCPAWRTSGHLAFAVRGSCVILATTRGDSGGCRAESRLNATPPLPRHAPGLSSPPPSFRLGPCSPRALRHPPQACVLPATSWAIQGSQSPTSKSRKDPPGEPLPAPPQRRTPAHTCPPPVSAQGMMAPQALPFLHGHLLASSTASAQHPASRLDSYLSPANAVPPTQQTEGAPLLRVPPEPLTLLATCCLPRTPPLAS